MKNLIFYSILFATTMFHLHAQLHQVGPEDASTAFGYYAVSPESPDGSTIAYIKYTKAPTKKAMSQPAELWICDRDATNHRKVTDIGYCPTHNGSRAIWLSNDRIVVQGATADGPTGGLLQVITVPDGERIFEPFHATLMGQTLFGNKLLFWIWPEEEALCQREAGPYTFDYQTGEIEKIFDMEQFYEFAKDSPESVSRKRPRKPFEEFRIYHLKYSPNGKIIAFRPDVFERNGGGKLLAFYHVDSGTFSWFEDFRPNHYFWYDNESIAGHDINKDREPFRNLRRFDLQGNPIEDLGPPGVHGAPNPDMTAFATDSMFYHHRGILYFRKSEFEKNFINNSTEHFDSVRREMRFHENPSFSRDGRRIYFNMGISDDLNGTFYYDLDEDPRFAE